MPYLAKNLPSALVMDGVCYCPGLEPYIFPPQPSAHRRLGHTAKFILAFELKRSSSTFLPSIHNSLLERLSQPTRYRHQECLVLLSHPKLLSVTHSRAERFSPLLPPFLVRKNNNYETDVAMSSYISNGVPV